MTNPIGHYAANVTATAAAAAANGAAGSIPADADFVSYTSASANNFVVLPSNAEIGRRIEGWVGANGFKLQTLASSGQTINNVDTTTTAVAVIPANRKVIVSKMSATIWVLETLTNLGAVGTAIVPA